MDSDDDNDDDDDDDNDADDDVENGEDGTGKKSACDDKASVGGSGGEEKFWRGPGLVSPRHSQQDDENRIFDVRDKTPPGATEMSRLTSRSVSVGIVPSRCSRLGEEFTWEKL